MRPVRLELKNFTAYREAQVLDFGDLDLFAITGDNGSGKSSLLDAMTYALYGKAPRVGKGVSQLVAVGQPRLAVLFEFQVGGQGYRVARETPTQGASSIRLERRMEGEWVSAGDGADRINDANDMIEKLIGLDYVGFTRSIILPQGEFAEFIGGDPKDRRRILTELMDLDLFERMARRAGEVARAAKAAAETTEGLLARHYAGADEAAVKEARKRARHARLRAEAMADVQRVLEGLARESEDLERRIEALEQLADECVEAGRAAEAVVAELDRVVGGLGAADSRAAALEEAAASAEAAAGVAARDVEEAEERWGSAESLATLRAGLEQLGGLEGRIAAAKGSRARATGMVESGEHALAEARTRTVLATAAAEETARALADAEAEHDRAYRHDVVGALTKGKRVGDPCPVCDRPLEALPRIDARELSRVRKALDRANEAARRATAGAAEADRDASLAERDLRTATGEVSRLDQELEALRAERAGMLPTLEAAMGGPLPESPVAEVDRRLDDLRLLRRRGEECTAAAASARDQAAAAREVSRDLTAQSAAMVGTLRGVPIPGLLRKVRQRLPQGAAPPSLVGAIPGEPRAALEAAVGIAAGASELTRMLREATAEARAGLEAILDRARSHLPDGMPRSVLGDLDDLLEAARLSAKDLVEEAAEANGAARRLAQQLKESRELREEAGARRAEGAVYQALAGELRADRLIDFLQGEALELLAAAGSERLLFLSQGRYRLAFEGDEFFVEDRQNGDERRSVRTLSGGETFLASLALALALSEQIRSLAVTSRARLESLFIDEGFGNLDAETLEVATEALSQLGGQGRMVGVITHVSELAERLPVRVEVRKFPGGSRLEVLA